MRLMMFVLAGLCLSNGILFAQQTRVHYRNQNVFLSYNATYQFASKFGVHFDAQWRNRGFFEDRLQLVLRAGVEYLHSDHIKFTAGYAYASTYQSAEGLAVFFPEHRLWEQLSINQAIGKWKLVHRYRIEQRKLASIVTGDFAEGRFEHRFRYMARVSRSLSAQWKRPIYVAVSDEIFLNCGRDVAYNLFDQNRLYGGFGVSLTSGTKCELGYFRQTLQQRPLDVSGVKPMNIIEDNSNFQLAVFTTIGPKLGK